MTRPDFGPGDFDCCHDDHDADDARAERDQLSREAAADARELRDNGWDAAGERAAANEERDAA